MLRVAAVLLAGLLVAAMPSPAQALLPVPHGHVYNDQSPHCLSYGNAQGAVMVTCSAAATQQWNTLNYQIRGGGKCLDEGAGLNGSRVFLATCTGSSHQKWIVLLAGSETWANLASGRCLDADTSTAGQEGTKVQVWDCAGLANQRWTFEFVGD